jgi:hypothetical protein
MFRRKTVVNGGLGDDAGIADVPWASVFDPDLNMKAIGAIQARGFRAATEVVDRLIRAADRGSATETPSADGDKADGYGAERGEAEGARRSGQPDVDRMMASWQNMVGQLAQSLRDSVAPPASGPTAATFDLVAAQASGQISLEAAGPGTAATELWLHNGGPTDLGKVRLRCSDLLAHDGGLIGAAAVRFEPDTVPMPARSSRGVTVEIDIAEEVAPGQYRGTLLADGHADVWLPVALVVKSAVP